jgi:hypothetical protein
MHRVDIGDWKNGWLSDVDRPFSLTDDSCFENLNYSIINVTERYRDRFFKWDKEVRYLHSQTDMVCLIGHEQECASFFDDLRPKTRDRIYRHLRTPDLLQAARWISRAKHFSGNQSVMLAIRQGFGLPYRFEQSPNHLDTEQGDNPNETIINPFTRRLHLATVCVKKMLFDNKQKRYHA